MSAHLESSAETPANTTGWWSATKTFRGSRDAELSCGPVSLLSGSLSVMLATPSRGCAFASSNLLALRSVTKLLEWYIVDLLNTNRHVCSALYVCCLRNWESCTCIEHA